MPVFGSEELRLLEKIHKWIKRIVSLLLYLCSTNDIKRDGKTTYPVPPRTGGKPLPLPGAPAQWEVGTRMGNALRAAYVATEANSDTIPGAHRRPRPHIRRAHWHGFRSGPIKEANGDKIPAVNRQFQLHWLPPVPVNMADFEDMPVVIRKVE